MRFHDEIACKRALTAAFVLFDMGVAGAQSLPEGLEPGIPSLAEALGPAALVAAPKAALHQWSIGASTVSLAPGARAKLMPLSWTRRETLESGDGWVLQAQTDGYKRVALASAERNGLADVALSSAWERSLGDRRRGRATAGVIIPSHGEVGGKNFAAMLGVGLAQALAGNGQAGTSILVVQNAPPAKPGASRTLWRADANLGMTWSPGFKTSLSGAYAYQESAPKSRELALLMTVTPQPGAELRLRVWEQAIDAAPRRRGVGISLALIR